MDIMSINPLAEERVDTPERAPIAAVAQLLALCMATLSGPQLSEYGRRYPRGFPGHRQAALDALEDLLEGHLVQLWHCCGPRDG